jgi:hypothetical protein
MWIKIRGVAPDLTITDDGCGCCSDSQTLTRALLQEAIQEAEEWLAELKAIDPGTLPE